MENKGLLFIPDISGFTRFVNKVDIEHGKMIIQELLEILVKANEIGLVISEIEGDAILFYKYGDSPDMQTLYKQVEKMFTDFHKSLYAYDISRYCQCTACSSAIDLTLKVITHYGEFMDYKVADFKKLIGKDIIVAHQLLKNDIEQHEYWLVTDPLISESAVSKTNADIQWNNSVKHTDEGDINFQYAPLTGLKKKISPEEERDLEIADKVKVMSFTREIDTDIITLFRTSGMFEYRKQWLEGLKDVEILTHYLPRIGMSCRYIRDSGKEIIRSTSYTFNPDKITFTETDEKRENAVTYTLERITDQKTRLTMDYYQKKSFVSQLLFNLKDKKKKEALIEKSLDNLEQLVKVIEFPF